MKTSANITGVFDLDTGRLIGLAPKGTSDVTYVAGQDTATPAGALPVTATTDPVTGGIGFSGPNGYFGFGKQAAHRLVVLGDSIAIAGDTINATYDQRYDSFSDAAAALSDGRIQFVRNAGHGGDKSADLLARFDADVTPWRPTMVFVIVGTNDFTQGVSDSVFRSNIVAIEQKVRSIGATPVFFTSPPVNSFGVGEVQRVVRNGIWMRRWANQKDILVIDSFGLSIDPAGTGAWLSALVNGDGIHPNSAGHQAWGAAAATIINALLPTIKTGSYFNGDPLNLVTNGLFQAGTTIATGYSQTWGPDAGTAAFSVITDAAMPGGKAQRHTLTSATGHASLSQTVSTGFAPGDVISMECDTNLACVGGYSHIEATFTGSTGLTVVSSRRSLQGRSKFNREFTVPAGTTAIKFTMSSGYGSGAVTGTVDFGGLTIRNLSAPAGSYGNDAGSIA